MEGANLIIWVDKQARVVSFHPIEGYEQIELSHREFFSHCLLSLTELGYRFMCSQNVSGFAFDRPLRR